MAIELNAILSVRDYRTPDWPAGSSDDYRHRCQYVAKAFSIVVVLLNCQLWRNSSEDDVENRKLWKRIIAAADGLQLTWRKVKSHNWHPKNERAGALAKAAAKRAKPARMFWRWSYKKTTRLHPRSGRGRLALAGRN